MRRCALLFAVILCSLMLIACGGGSSSSQNSNSAATDTSSVISGSAIKGPIDGAEIKLYYFGENGSQIEIIAENAPVLTTPSGGFEFKVDPGALEGIETPLLLRSAGGSMGGQPAPVLESIIPGTADLENTGQGISRYLSTASSVAAKMITRRAINTKTAPSAADVQACIAKIEEAFEIELGQDPGDDTQGVAMVNLNVDENLDLFNTPENNVAVEEYITYLAGKLDTASFTTYGHGRGSDDSDDSDESEDDGDDDDDLDDRDDDDADNDRDDEFDGIGDGHLGKVCPKGPSRFHHLMVKADKVSILNDGVDAATIHVKLANAWGRSVDEKIQIDLVIVDGEGVLSDTSPALNRGRAMVTFTSTIAGPVMIQASHTLDNGNTIIQKIKLEVVDNSQNAAPMADAGSNQNVTTGSVVTLDGGQSSDPNNDPLTYAWTLVTTPSGSNAALSDMTLFNPTFTPDVDGIYVVELVVNDGTTDSAPATVTITASSGNSAPTANAGPNQNVTTGANVTLDGSGSSDADGDPLTYAWTLTSAPAGSSAALSNANQVNPTFTADVDGTYVIELIVDDGTIASSPATVTVNAASGNSAPTADAGPNQNVATFSVVTLDGSGSSDADNDPLTYAWRLVSTPAGSSTVLSNPADVNPTFTADMDGTYVVELIVNDGTTASSPATVTITASTANSAPTANAGPNQSVSAGTIVTLNGSGSSDPDNDALTYNWTLVSRPTGSTATLPNPADTEQVFITPDVAGDYVVQLVVNDGTVNSAADRVTITATAAGPDGAALYSANCAACHGPDGSRIFDLRGIAASEIVNTMPHQGVTLNDIGGTAGAQAMADFLGP